MLDRIHPFRLEESRTPQHRSFALLALLELCIVATPCAGVAQSLSSTRGAGSQPIYLVVRSDDGGMSHSVNMALEKIISSGIPVSVSVMFPTPWYQETVEILKHHPETSVGIHLTLNSEWKNYRWGPILGRTAVPSLVDADGYFFQSVEALHRNNPKIGEVEKELRAQIERALHSGLKIDYVDYHMGAAVSSPEFRALTERLAKEYGLGMSQYFGETRGNPQYEASPPDKADSLVAMIARLNPGINLVVTHLGIDNAELGALVDMNTDGALPDMSKNRQGELDAITSQRVRDALKARDVRLITYRQLIEMKGLSSMHRPEATN